MSFARRMLRIPGALLLILAIVFMFACGGMAEDSDPVAATIQVSPDSLTAPGEVSVSLRVSNPTGTDMIDPVTLYDPAGSLVASFGDGGSYILKSGDSRSWEGKWTVTQAQLEAGTVAYTLRYHIEDADGGLVEMNKQVTAKLNYVRENGALTVKRTISPEVVRSGGQASVTYELYNSGNVELTDIRVQETISKTAKTVKSLPAGGRTTVQFTSRIGNADLTSSASITYKAAGSSKTEKITVEEAVIPLAKPDLKIELSTTSESVTVGEAVTLVITFTNAGNVSYSNVAVTEAKRGEILTNLNIPAGATVTEQKEFILMEPAEFKVTATLPDNTGETKTLTSKELKVGVFDPEKQLLLTLNLTCDQENVPSAPADVKFHLTVTNNSNIKAEKIAITHGSVAIYTIAALEPGESIVLDRDVTISQTGQFRFTASLKDSLNNTVTFESNTIRIGIDRSTPAPTAVPAVTVAPPTLVTAAPVDPLLGQTRSAMQTAAMVMGALCAAALALFLVSTVVRLVKRGKSQNAFDHLDLAERRDYTGLSDDDEFSGSDEDDGDSSHEADDQDFEWRTENGRADESAELPHEKVLRQTAMPEWTDGRGEANVMPGTDEEGGYRVSRAQSQAAPEAPQQVEKPAEAPAPQTGAEEAAAGDPGAETPAEPPRRRRRSARREDGE